VTPGVAIIGCGLVGNKRAAALAGARLVACADVELARAERLAASVAMSGHRASDIAVSDAWSAAVNRPDVDIVIVATTNDGLAEIAAGALAAGKHVLVEKPAGRSIEEITPVVDAAKRAQKLVRVGFNHRYHPAVKKARELCQSGVAGALMFVRGRYGHGGRVGYDKEWRADPRMSGGGELIDQGVHLVDLSRWFLGDFPTIGGFAHTYFWQMPVDDNAFLMLRTRHEQTAFLHVSCTEWKNLFSYEIYGRDAKLHIEGLGGSYGTERLRLYTMKPEMGPPDETVWEFPGPDDSWAVEFAEFLEDIRLNRAPAAGLADAQAALAIVDEVYRQSGYRLSAPSSVSIQ
jgi:predicted dehydrogenase